MSHFTGSHLITAFDAKKSAPLSGQRLAKIRYKTTANTPAKFPSVCVSVPYIAATEVTENISRLMPYVLDMLASAQDGVIRSLYESADGTLSAVSDSDISINSCIGYLEAESQGTRLTKEFIEAWFDSQVRDYLYALTIEKLKYSDDLTPEQEIRVNQNVTGYRGMYSALAGGKTLYTPEQIKPLRKVLELIDSDDTGAKLDARLVSMLNKPSMAELLEF